MAQVGAGDDVTAQDVHRCTCGAGPGIETTGLHEPFCGQDPYEGHRHEKPCPWCHEPESLCRCEP